MARYEKSLRIVYNNKEYLIQFYPVYPTTYESDNFWLWIRTKETKDRSWKCLIQATKESNPYIYNLMYNKYKYNVSNLDRKAKFELLFFSRKLKPILEAFLKTDFQS